VDESAVTDWRFDWQDITPFAKKNTNPDVDLRSSISPAKSESEYPCKVPVLFARALPPYWTPSSCVPLIYLSNQFGCIYVILTRISQESAQY
jgi:hypothetical protein